MESIQTSKIEVLKTVNTEIYKDIACYVFDLIIPVLQSEKIRNSLYDTAIYFFLAKKFASENPDILMVYFNKYKKDLVFINEIQDITDEYLGFYIYQNLTDQQKQELKDHGELIDTSKLREISQNIIVNLSDFHKTKIFFGQIKNFYKENVIHRYERQVQDIFGEPENQLYELNIPFITSDLKEQLYQIINLFNDENQFYIVNRTHRFQIVDLLDTELHLHLSSTLPTQKIIGISKLSKLIPEIKSELEILHSFYETKFSEVNSSKHFIVDQTPILYTIPHKRYYNLLEYLAFHKELSEIPDINSLIFQSPFLRAANNLYNFLIIGNQICSNKILETEIDSLGFYIRKIIYQNQNILIDNDTQEITPKRYHYPYSDLIKYCIMYSKSALDRFNHEFSTFFSNFIIYKLSFYLINLIKEFNNKGITGINNFLITQNDPILKDSQTKLLHAITPKYNPATSHNLFNSLKALQTQISFSYDLKIESHNPYMVLLQTNYEAKENFIAQTIFEHGLEYTIQTYLNPDFLQEFDSQETIILKVLESILDIENFDEFNNYVNILKKFDNYFLNQTIKANPFLAKTIYYQIKILFQNYSGEQRNQSYVFLYHILNMLRQINVISETTLMQEKAAIAEIAKTKFNTVRYDYINLTVVKSPTSTQKMTKTIQYLLLKACLQNNNGNKHISQEYLDLIMSIIQDNDLLDEFKSDLNTQIHNSFFIENLFKSSNSTHNQLAEELIDQKIKCIIYQSFARCPKYIFRVFYLINNPDESIILSDFEELIKHHLLKPENQSSIDKLQEFQETYISKKLAQRNDSARINSIEYLRKLLKK